MNKKKNDHDDSAITDVLGTVLLLGIAVALFSIVYLSVLSVPYSPPTPSANIVFSFDGTDIILTHFGGKDLELDTEIRITIGDDSPIEQDVEVGLDAEAILDNYWSIGEQFVYAATNDVLDNSIEVLVIDGASNSIVMTGRKLIETNRPPVISSPSPSNGATGVSISISEINVEILDPNSDSFDWTIETKPNIGSGSGSDESDGVKTCSVSGIAEVTVYTWYVNATDTSGSGQWTNKTYTFTTGTIAANNPPVFGTPTPANESTDQSLSFTWEIPINDPNTDPFNWEINCNNGQTNSTTGDNDGTKTLALSVLSESTTYKIWVNATDPTGSGETTHQWYTFTTGTIAANNPPVFGTPTPANESTDQSLSFTWEIPINDPNTDPFNWEINCNNGQTNSTTGDNDGTKTLALSVLSESTTYKIWVNATDPTGSAEWTRRWYTFTTQSASNTIVYNFSSGAGTTHYAYGTYSDSWVSDLKDNRDPNECDTEIDAVAGDAYADLAYSDATGGDADPNRYINPDQGSNDESTMICEFYISEDRSSVTQLDVLWEGYGDSNGNVELYIWNYAQGDWGDLSNNVGENNYIERNNAFHEDITLQGSATSAITNYIDTDGEITLLIYMDTDSEASYHDYVSVTITT